jgi:RNAse (barnase) inhibitor barstar
VTKTELLDILDANLGFPDYFGRNWDALDECIRDLSWLAPVQIVVFREDVPLHNDSAGASTYLSILRDAVRYWNLRPEHRLVVVFPEEYETLVRQLATE